MESIITGWCVRSGEAKFRNVRSRLNCEYRGAPVGTPENVRYLKYYRNLPSKRPLHALVT